MSGLRALVSWSSGKDSAWALAELRRTGTVEIVGLLTTVTSGYARVSMHGVREAILDLQAEAAGLPCRKVAIPPDCSNARYEEALGGALRAARREGVSHVVFGDLFLEDIRAYRERLLASMKLSGLFPLWGRDTARLARQMLAGGLEARITCLDPKRLDASLSGRRFDEALLEELPEGVDPCGENGEFHTLAVAGPMFRFPIEVVRGETVGREGFVFTDFLPRDAAKSAGRLAGGTAGL
jgi:uncharacterized protein (TIGR00290 family)